MGKGNNQKGNKEAKKPKKTKEKVLATSNTTSKINIKKPIKQGLTCMKSGEKLYLIENLDIYAVIINERLMNNIPHYNLVIHRGQSESKTCLSKVALEVFYQKQLKKKKIFLIFQAEEIILFIYFR